MTLTKKKTFPQKYTCEQVHIRIDINFFRVVGSNDRDHAI